MWEKAHSYAYEARFTICNSKCWYCSYIRKLLKQSQQYWDVNHWSWIELNKHYCIQVDSHWPPSTSMVVHRQWTSHDGTRGNVTYLPTNRIDLITYQKLHFGMNLQMTGLLVAEHILSANESCIASAFDLFLTIYLDYSITPQGANFWNVALTISSYESSEKIQTFCSAEN